jgi:hypothetical protein
MTGICFRGLQIISTMNDFSWGCRISQFCDCKLLRENLADYRLPRRRGR